MAMHGMAFHPLNRIGQAIAAGIKQVSFDRSGYQYHGRVKALADGARKAGLEF